MALKLTNNAISQLASSITPAETSITLKAGAGSKFPTLGAGDYFPCTISKADGTFEIVRVTARSGDTLTVARAQEGTTALAFDANSLIELRLTADTVLSLPFQYQSKTVSANTTLDTNTEYVTGSGLRVINGVTLHIPITTKLEVKAFGSGKNL